MCVTPPNAHGTSHVPCIYSEPTYRPSPSQATPHALTRRPLLPHTQTSPRVHGRLPHITSDTPRTRLSPAVSHTHPSPTCPNHHTVLTLAYVRETPSRTSNTHTPTKYLSPPSSRHFPQQRKLTLPTTQPPHSRQTPHSSCPLQNIHPHHACIRTMAYLPPSLSTLAYHRRPHMRPHPLSSHTQHIPVSPPGSKTEDPSASP